MLCAPSVIHICHSTNSSNRLTGCMQYGGVPINVPTTVMLFWLQVIVVPLFAGLFGARIPMLTWGAGTAALVGVGLLESSGAPPSVNLSLTFASLL